MRPLQDIKVLDFGTLLPGPLASLLLAEAGADVIKIERPGRGDEMRSYTPKFGVDSINFAMLNRGKRSLAIDLKSDEDRERLMPLIAAADVLIEQFRPGVMDRLGLGYEALRALNPRLIYCSITGYGQSGPAMLEAGHDLNFCARTGMLALSGDRDGRPAVPAALVADIAGGTYPAVLNVLLALRQRDLCGAGCRLDIAMAENLFTLQYWALGDGLAAARWPRAGGELTTGGSPRYNIYRTADDRFVAAAPIEDKFWTTFCSLVGLDPDDVDEIVDPGTCDRVADRIRAEPAAYWTARFDGHDVCCSIVASLEEALDDPHFAARGVFAHRLAADGREVPALPVPIDPAFRGGPAAQGYPTLGEANATLLTSGPHCG